MIAKIKVSLGKVLQFIGVLFFLRHRSIDSTRALLAFRRSSGVGNSIYKIYVRYREISKSIDCFMPEKFVALEFGSGSSTILFYSIPRVSRLISIEEDETFLPQIKVKEKVWESPPLSTKMVNWEDYRSQVFQETFEFIEVADLIYIDGPSNSKNEIYNLAEPNLELIEFNNLNEKLVLIDCRTLTVCELSLKLKNTHDLIMSKAVLHEYETFLRGKKGFPHMEDLLEGTPKIAKKRMGFHPVRTSVFIPRNYEN
jgi:hypothetical protein